MWFAFKIYIFDILIQHVFSAKDTVEGCDLLSKFISLIFWYNNGLRINNATLVVICFQNLYLWYSDTTPVSFFLLHKCCDLLSKFISLIFWYNFGTLRHRNNNVVICFQNLYLWYSDTTKIENSVEEELLWFAFKIYIFDILIQQFSYYSANFFRCDLLSKFISLIFWYNARASNENSPLVVICFQNLYLWYSDTTQTDYDKIDSVLWFAFKIYIFDILIQRDNELVNGKVSCDLLSKFISLIFWYNYNNDYCPVQMVVICFQNLYLWYSDTTSWI